MPEGIQLWSPREMYALLTDDRNEPIPSHFLDTYFTETHFSNEKEIIIGELPQVDRKMAPFVLPTEQGKPIFGARGEKVKALTPPYIKPKDACRPEDARTPRPSEVMRRRPLTLQERFNLRVAEIADYHRRAIRMQEAYMAARAFIDGKVTIKYDRDQGAAFPEVTIDFGRDAGQTVSLTAGTGYWSDPDYPILDDISDWGNLMRAAVRGGFPVRMYVGAAVAKVFRNNKQIRQEMDTTFRGNDVTLQTGIINQAEPMSYMGTVGAGIQVFSYKDEVENSNGALIDLLDPRDIVLVAPGATGVRAYGSIYDVDAMSESQAIDIFPKMFKTQDPGELFVMHQASPLPIMLYGNRTLKARVLA